MRATPAAVVGSRPLQQFSESFDGETCVAHNTSHGVGIDRIVAGMVRKPLPLDITYVLGALSHDFKARLLQRPHGAQMRNAGNFGHASGLDFDFSYQGCAGGFSDGAQILANGVLNVVDRCLLGGSLRPAPRQTGT